MGPPFGAAPLEHAIFVDFHEPIISFEVSTGANAGALDESSVGEFVVLEAVLVAFSVELLADSSVGFVWQPNVRRQSGTSKAIERISNSLIKGEQL